MVEYHILCCYEMLHLLPAAAAGMLSHFNFIYFVDSILPYCVLWLHIVLRHHDHRILLPGLIEDQSRLRFALNCFLCIVPFRVQLGLFHRQISFCYSFAYLFLVKFCMKQTRLSHISSASNFLIFYCFSAANALVSSTFRKTITPTFFYSITASSFSSMLHYQSPPSCS